MRPRSSHVISRLWSNWPRNLVSWLSVKRGSTTTTTTLPATFSGRSFENNWIWLRASDGPSSFTHGCGRRHHPDLEREEAGPGSSSLLYGRRGTGRLRARTGIDDLVFGHPDVQRRGVYPKRCHAHAGGEDSCGDRLSIPGACPASGSAQRAFVRCSHSRATGRHSWDDPRTDRKRNKPELSRIV